MSEIYDGSSGRCHLCDRRLEVGVMREQCSRCKFNTHNPHLPCTVHPIRAETESCPDFAIDPAAESEELWQPVGAAYYNGELIYQPEQRWTRQQQLELLLWHPLFTGRCPDCGEVFPAGDRVHWDCDWYNRVGLKWAIVFL